MHPLTEHWPAWLDACKTANLAISEELPPLFESVYDQLIAYNQQVNLTRLTEPTDFLYAHLLDSLSLLPYIPQNAYLADVGSGAGFPAIPLAMARPDIRVVAIESVGKKCQFIRQIQESFNLGDRLQVVNARSEDLGQQGDYRERFDVVTARAVASLPVLLELTLPLVKPKGQFLALKGPTYQAELETVNKALHILKGRLQEVHPPFHEAQRRSILIRIEKTGQTPAAYPRKPGIPSKNPL